MPQEAPEFTRLLNDAASGDDEAARRIFPIVYGELKRIAAARRRDVPAGETLRTTALVHEAFLRLVRRKDGNWDGRSHFFFVAARAIRDILVEEARKKSAAKRGGDLQRVTLDDIGHTLENTPDEVLSLHRALEKLEVEDPDEYRLVMLRYFTGLTVSEIAELQQVSTRTIERRWKYCRAWLARELQG